MSGGGGTSIGMRFGPTPVCLVNGTVRAVPFLYLMILDLTSPIYLRFRQ